MHNGHPASAAVDVLYGLAPGAVWFAARRTCRNAGLDHAGGETPVPDLLPESGIIELLAEFR